MIKVSSAINAFNYDKSSAGNFFTGAMNMETLPFDPLVTGYAIIKWVTIPKWVETIAPGFKELTEKNFKSFDGISDMELQTAAYAHTYNGNEYNYATSITKNNTEFTLKHQEFSGNPIKNGYQAWVTGIRDPRTDVATYPKIFDCDYAAANHTGKLLYIVLRPDVDNIDRKNIEFAAYFTNVFPTKVPLSHFNYSQNDHNSPEIDITFKATMHISPKIDEFAQKTLKNSYGFIYEGEYDPDEFSNAGGGEILITRNKTVNSDKLPSNDPEGYNG